MKKLSVIVPTYNEATNIQDLIMRIHQSLTSSNIVYEILFIDDHSTDNTKTVIDSFSSDYPISFYLKKGKKGKAYSLDEGLSYIKNEYIAFIDADLQYPPEALPEMVQKLQLGADVVVANRKQYKSSKVRKFITSSFKNIFGKFLFGLDHDIQSGMKVFTKEVSRVIKFNPKSGWTFDLEFIHRATQAGFKVENHDIAFEKRVSGNSKVSFLQTSLEIGLNALLLRANSLPPQQIPSETNDMRHTGMSFKKKRYITHTSLHHSQSAIITFLREQKIIFGLLFVILLEFFFINPLLTLQVFVGVLSLIYFIDVFFNLFLILKSLHFSHEITYEAEEIAAIDETQLPVYSILCPLYKEAHVIPFFLKSISKLDYPKDKLDVILLLEEDDTEVPEATKLLGLPS